MEHSVDPRHTAGLIARQNEVLNAGSGYDGNEGIISFDQ